MNAPAPVFGSTSETEKMNELGDEYYYGRNGKRQDYAEAVRWYRKAAELGCGYGQCNMGICCEWGNGVKEDCAEAARWYRKGAEQDLPVAQYFLANLYRDGKGVPYDVEEAIRWYRKAAALGDEDAAKELDRLIG